MVNSFFLQKIYPLVNIVFLLGLGYVFVVVGDEVFASDPAITQVSANFLSNESETDTSSIDLSSVTSIIIETNDENDTQTVFFEYTIQPGDNLSTIATQFSTTVANIKRVNNISSTQLRVGQKIFISSVEGFITQIAEKTNLVIFANQYDIPLEDLMNVNNISNKLMIIDKGEEIFLPLSREEGIARGLIDTNLASLQQDIPTPKSQKTVSPTRVLVGNIPSSQRNVPNKNTTNQPVRQPTNTTPKNNSQHVVSQRASSSRVWNGFAAGFCTYYAALKSPRAFPFVSQGKQYKTWSGNGNQRYSRAKSAGFRVSATPSVGAIVVISRAAGAYASAGHVGIVVDVDRNQKRFMIEDMNYYGLWVVTRRWVYMDDSMTKAIANSQPIVGFIPKQETPERVLKEAGL